MEDLGVDQWEVQTQQVRGRVVELSNGESLGVYGGMVVLRGDCQCFSC